MIAAPVLHPGEIAAWIDDLQPALAAVENCRVSLEGIAALLAPPRRVSNAHDLDDLRSQIAGLAAVVAEVLRVNGDTIDDVLERMAPHYDARSRIGHHPPIGASVS